MTHQTSKIPPQRLYSLIENLTTEEKDVTKFFAPDGDNGVHAVNNPNVDQAKMIYVSKVGNDSNSGLNMNSPKLTIQEAILDAIALFPSETNQITIEVIDTGDYTDAVNLQEWIHLKADNASLDGILDIADNCIVSFRRCQRTTAGGSCIKKTTGTGFAKIAVELLIVTTGQNGLLANSGVIHIDAGVITVDGGIGIKGKDGARVSFILSELQLLNGGVGIGTQTAGGDPNSFSGNILYAKDDGTGILLESKVSGDIINIQGGSFIVNTLYDMGANSTLNVFATESQGVNRLAHETATINATLAGGGIPNEFIITELSDLPTPIGNVITLPENDVVYKFAGSVDLGVNSIVITGTNIKFHGTNPATDKIISSTTGDVITSDLGINIQDLQLVGFSATTLLKCTGTNAEFLSSERMTYLGGVTQIDVTDFDTVAVNFGLHQLCTNAIVLDGNFMSYIHLTCLFRDVTGVGIDLGTAIFSAVGIHLCTCVNTATTTFLSMLPDDGNLIPAGEGTITECKIDTTLGGSGSVGYSPLDLLWYSSGNRDIITSDRILFSGWEFEVDDAVTPIVFTSTAQKLLNNGLDPSSNSNYLPQAIRGTGTLFDTTTSLVTPIIEGDTYALRVQVTIDVLAGNPTELRLALDIGGDTSPTIIVAQDTKAIKGISEPIIFSFPIFAGATFISNGGAIFMNTDTGTATVGFRSVLLTRTSSGAS